MYPDAFDPCHCFFVPSPLEVVDAAFYQLTAMESPVTVVPALCLKDDPSRARTVGRIGKPHSSDHAPLVALEEVIDLLPIYAEIPKLDVDTVMRNLAGSGTRNAPHSN